MAALSQNRLFLFSLFALVIGSMIGAGLLSLSRIIVAATGPFGAMLTWGMAAGGMCLLARVFQVLAERRFDLDAGVHACARAGSGDDPG